jgi:hypothetical protein
MVCLAERLCCREPGNSPLLRPSASRLKFFSRRRFVSDSLVPHAVTEEKEGERERPSLWELTNRPGPHTALHTCTVLSSLPEAMRLPSGDHATAST